MTVKEIETLKNKVFTILNSRTMSSDSKMEIFPVKPTDFLLEFDIEKIHRSIFCHVPSRKKCKTKGSIVLWYVSLL